MELTLYIVMYNIVANNIRHNQSVCKFTDITSAFSNEADMLKEVIKLKKDNCVENIRVYVNKYSLESCEKYDF